MKPGRNDPCPCGSGKKYKNCHARSDAADAPKLRLLGHDSASEMQAMALQAISRPVIWEADVTPVPASIETHPTSRSAAVMLAAEDLVLDADFVTDPPSDAEGVATLIAKAIAKQVARGGAPPLEVFVRHAEVAECLAPKLRHHGVVPVQASRQLPMLDEFAGALRQQLTGGSMPLPAVSCPPAWAGWGLPEPVIGALHVAAANFYAAKPWELLDNEDTLELTMPSGSRWFAAVMGAAGETFGLAMYESLDDVHAVLTSPPDATGLVPMLSVVLSLTFDFRADLEKPMRREASDKGWPIAGPSAYPVLWAMNTIGGGVSETQILDLTHALGAIGRFAERLDSVTTHGAAPVGDEWIDEATGTVVAFGAPLPVGRLWDVPLRLSTCLPEGARANPADLCLTNEDRSAPSEADAALLARFIDAARAVGTKEKRVTQDRNNVAHFIEVTRLELGVHLPALTEFDLRMFLYDIMPRRTLGPKSHGHDMRQSLKRFFAYLAASEELHYPWAADILGDKFALDERWDSRPGGFGIDEGFDWSMELMEDMFARVMLASPLDATDYDGVPREKEMSLNEELQRSWLVWRDEEIRAGVDEPDALRVRLLERQAEWSRAPQARLDGRTPADVIAEERKGGRRISRRRR